MRVVSMVPSWTETLIEAGVDVVGRTRFCVHPRDAVVNIPVVGGTKNWNEKSLQKLEFDLLVLDKEENPRFMAEAGFPYWASHIQSIRDVPTALENVAAYLQNEQLLNWARQWRDVNELPEVNPTWLRLPILKWLVRPNDSLQITDVYYVIWRDPWMVVSDETFIGSVLEQLGLRTKNFGVKYPVVEWSDLDKPGAFVLFASEPYPFLKRPPPLPERAAAAAMVDGELMSWFGVRSLRFFENLRLNNGVYRL